MKKILVTGGAGFIGSEFVRQIVGKGYSVIVVDKLTYAGDLARLKEVEKKYKFFRADISDSKRMSYIFQKERPDLVVNFAAETHVDRSIQDSAPFLKTNIEGTRVLLELSRKYKIKKYLQISTDEIYGEIEKGKFKETSPLRPNSPYAVSKASADFLVQAYVRTYQLPALIVRACNNYGPWQYPEKLIPLIIWNALENKKIPIYARGLNVREWLYVSDCASAIYLVLKKGKLGEIYNIGSGVEKRNIELARQILKLLGKSERLIKFVKDRPGHDFRYALDFSKLRKLGWKPKMKFEQGIRMTVLWYEENLNWLKKKVEVYSD